MRLFLRYITSLSFFFQQYNIIFLQYGATGSGKTHTMLGANPRKAATPASESTPPTTTAGGDGLMVQAIADIYKHIEAAEKPDTFKVKLNGNTN